MIDLKRYKQLAIVSAATLLTLAFWNMGLGALHAQSSPHVRAVLDRMDPDLQRTHGATIARLEDALEQEPGPLAVILGMSTAFRGIDPQRMPRPGNLRWSNLASFGGSYSQLRYYIEPLMVSDIRPEIAMIAAHPAWLAERGESNETPAGAGHVVSHSVLPKALEPWFWARRNHLSLGIDLSVQRARLRLLHAMDVDLTSLFPRGAEEPWAARYAFKTLKSPLSRARKLALDWESYGWYREAAFHRDSPEVENLKSLIAELQDRGTRVVFVLMPESSASYARIPSRARELMFDTLDEIGEVVVLDHARVVQHDELFYDPVHLNRKGRVVYSKFLSRDLAPVIRQLRKPLHSS